MSSTGASQAEERIAPLSPPNSAVVRTSASNAPTSSSHADEEAVVIRPPTRNSAPTESLGQLNTFSPEDGVSSPSSPASRPVQPVSEGGSPGTSPSVPTPTSTLSPPATFSPSSTTSSSSSSSSPASSCSSSTHPDGLALCAAATVPRNSHLHAAAATVPRQRSLPAQNHQQSQMHPSSRPQHTERSSGSTQRVAVPPRRSSTVASVRSTHSHAQRPHSHKQQQPKKITPPELTQAYLADLSSITSRCGHDIDVLLTRLGAALHEVCACVRVVCCLKCCCCCCCFVCLSRIYLRA
jgi:hypothetical protein